jgi:hypothetical protein
MESIGKAISGKTSAPSFPTSEVLMVNVLPSISGEAASMFVFPTFTFAIVVSGCP